MLRLKVVALRLKVLGLKVVALGTSTEWSEVISDRIFGEGRQLINEAK